jgi:tetratricopeptide (TPR) repeat protein
MRALFSIIVISVAFGALFLTERIIKSNNPPAITNEAIVADILLVNSKIYLDEGSVERGKEKLDKAIEKIQLLKAAYDDESIKHIDIGIEKLMEIDQQLEGKVINISLINDGYILMLNALTYAQIREAELYFEQDEYLNARKSLKYALTHIRNAIKLTDDAKLESEVRIYTEIDEIIENDKMEKEVIIFMLEKMLDELENLEIQLS